MIFFNLMKKKEKMFKIRSLSDFKFCLLSNFDPTDSTRV